MTSSRKRCGPPLPLANPLDCPGSLLPVPHLKPLDRVTCEFCGREVAVRPPPPDGFHDPWAGLDEPRVNPHWSNPMKSEPGN